MISAAVQAVMAAAEEAVEEAEEASPAEAAATASDQKTTAQSVCAVVLFLSFLICIAVFAGMNFSPSHRKAGWPGLLSEKVSQPFEFSSCNVCHFMYN